MGVSVEQFVENLTGSGLMSADEVAAFRQTLPDAAADGETLAKLLVRQKKLTKYQATAVYQGKIKHLMFGEYVVTDKIGAGGMGLVLKAEHRRMKRTVAVKVLPAQTMKNKAAVERFYREVEAAAKLNHTNIVTAHDAGEHEGLHFLVMEYVEGRDLASIVHDHGPMPIEEAVECVRQTACGLEYAHNKGIVHRDIKPGNLLLSQESSVQSREQDGQRMSGSGLSPLDSRLTIKILDMGLARFATADPGGMKGDAPKQLTESGQIMGTVDYMAPEQAEDTRKADHRADIYALGCTLFRLVTGQPVYERDTVMQKLLAHREDEIPSMLQYRSDVPARLAGIFQRMVAKNPDERYQSMTEVIAALDTAFIPAPQAARPAPKKAESSSSMALTEFFQRIGDQKVVTKPQTAVAPEETIDHQPSTEETGDSLEPVMPIAAAEIEQARSAGRSRPKRKKQHQRLLLIAGGGTLAAVLLIALAITLSGTSNEDNDSLTGGAENNLREAARESVASTPSSGNFAIEFDGKSSYVDVPSLHYDGSHPLTIEAMVSQSAGGWRPIVATPRKSDGFSFGCIGDGLEPSSLQFHIHDGRGFTYTSSEAVLLKEHQTHVAAVFYGREFRIFASGIAVSFEKFSGSHHGSADGLILGADIASSEGMKFSGTIDEVRISSIARYTKDFTPPQPHERFKKDEHTLALYHCDEIKDGKLIDSSGNGHHGTVHNCKLVRVDGPTMPPLAKAPFSEAEAKQHQEAWAEYLGVEVEREIVLPGGEKLTMVLIPPGEFLMGSTAEEQAKFQQEAMAAGADWAINRMPHEGPQHRVRITRPFYLGKCEVTQAQWRSVMGTTPSIGKYAPAHPMEQVSWDDVMQFLAKLNGSNSAERMTFALPTEAQWEHACRAGTTTAYYGGETAEDLAQIGWFSGNERGRRHAVGELKPNAFGLYDMHGNAWELCADWFAANYYAASATDDPTGPPSGTGRVHRGGSWLDGAWRCRSARRIGFAPGTNVALGLRLAAVIEDTSAVNAKTDDPPPQPRGGGFRGGGGGWGGGFGGGGGVGGGRSANPGDSSDGE